MALEPSIVKMEVHPGMRYLLCSDGLTDMLSDGEIADILTRELPVQETVELLLERALKRVGEIMQRWCFVRSESRKRPGFIKCWTGCTKEMRVMKNEKSNAGSGF